MGLQGTSTIKSKCFCIKKSHAVAHKVAVTAINMTVRTNLSEREAESGICISVLSVYQPTQNMW